MVALKMIALTCNLLNNRVFYVRWCRPSSKLVYKPHWLVRYIQIYIYTHTVYTINPTELGMQTIEFSQWTKLTISLSRCTYIYTCVYIYIYVCHKVWSTNRVFKQLSCWGHISSRGHRAPGGGSRVDVAKWRGRDTASVLEGMGLGAHLGYPLVN